MVADPHMKLVIPVPTYLRISFGYYLFTTDQNTITRGENVTRTLQEVAKKDV